MKRFEISSEKILILRRRREESSPLKYSTSCEIVLPIIRKKPVISIISKRPRRKERRIVLPKKIRNDSPEFFRREQSQRPTIPILLIFMSVIRKTLSTLSITRMSFKRNIPA